MCVCVDFQGKNGRVCVCVCVGRAEKLVIRHIGKEEEKFSTKEGQVEEKNNSISGRNNRLKRIPENGHRPLGGHTVQNGNPKQVVVAGLVLPAAGKRGKIQIVSSA